jgi:hypothetical protein
MRIIRGIALGGLLGLVGWLTMARDADAQLGKLPANAGRCSGERMVDVSGQADLCKTRVSVTCAAGLTLVTDHNGQTDECKAVQWLAGGGTKEVFSPAPCPMPVGVGAVVPPQPSRVAGADQCDGTAPPTCTSGQKLKVRSSYDLCYPLAKCSFDEARVDHSGNADACLPKTTARCTDPGRVLAVDAGGLGQWVGQPRDICPKVGDAGTAHYVIGDPQPACPTGYALQVRTGTDYCLASDPKLIKPPSCTAPLVVSAEPGNDICVPSTKSLAP